MGAANAASDDDAYAKSIGVTEVKPASDEDYAKSIGVAPVTPIEQDDAYAKSIGVAKIAPPIDSGSEYSTAIEPQNIDQPPEKEVRNVAGIDQGGAVDAAIRGGARGITAGLADEFTAAMGAAHDKAKGTPVTFPQAYVIWRDLIRKADKEAKTAHPNIDTAADLGGTVIGAGKMLKGGSLVRAGLLGSTQAAGDSEHDATKMVMEVLRIAGLLGSTQAAGDSEHDATKMVTEGVNKDSVVDFMKFLGDASLGGLFGVVGQKAFNVVADPMLAPMHAAIEDKMSAVPNMIERFANRRAFKAATGNQAAVYRQAAGKGIINDVGQDLRDSGVVKFGSDAKAIAERAGEKMDETWAKVTPVFHAADATGKKFVSGPAIADKIMDYAADSAVPGNKAIINHMMDVAAEFEQMGPMTFGQAAHLRERYKYSNGDPSKIPAGSLFYNKVKSFIGSEMEDAVDRFKPGTADPLREAKRLYGSFATAEGAASELALREQRNQDFGLGGKVLMAGKMAMGMHSPEDYLKLLAIGVGNNVARQRGSAMAASTAGMIANQGHDLVAKAMLYGARIPSLSVPVMQLAKAMLYGARIPSLSVPVMQLLKNPAKGPRTVAHIFKQPLGPGEKRTEHISDPDALAEIANAVQDSKDLDTVQKAKMLTKLHEDQGFDLEVSGPPAAPQQEQAPARPNMKTIQDAIDRIRGSAE